MFDIHVKVASAGDAEKAAAVFDAVAAILGGDSVADVVSGLVNGTPAPRRRGRPAKVAAVEQRPDDAAPGIQIGGDGAPITPTPIEQAIDDAKKADPATLYAALGGTLPADPAPTHTDLMVSPESVVGADTRTRDELLTAARSRAQTLGALWMRSVIVDKFKVKRLSDLTDEQLRFALEMPATEQAAAA